MLASVLTKIWQASHYDPQQGIRYLWTSIVVCNPTRPFHNAMIQVESQVDDMMLSRRKFVQTVFSIAGICLSAQWGASAEPLTNFQGQTEFNRLLAKATAERWQLLPIGALIGKIAMELQGTPYKDGTLELSADREICSCNLNALDCVTFVETTLAFARMLKEGGRTPESLLHQLCFIRYRGGSPGDYSTRLHYMSDWLADNESKHVLTVLAQLPGAAPFTKQIDFMTKHYRSYRQLSAHPELIQAVRRHEDTINHRSMTFVPIENISAMERYLKTGDIVAVCTNLPGLDVSHTGLVIRDARGVPRFMDASSLKSKMAVSLEPGPISRALRWSSSITGAMFARPLETVVK